MGRLERIKELKAQLEDSRQELLVAYKNGNWKHAHDILDDSKEMYAELDALYSFDEESAKLVGGDY
ncbi:MAG: hypothetical protein ACRC6B_04535 [Fusobacteriaceae bacterium]